MSASGTNNIIFKLQVQGDAEVVNKFKQVGAAMNTIAPAASKVASGTKQAETSLKSAGTAATQASTGFKNVGTSAQQAGNSANSATTGFRSYSVSLGSASSAAGTAATSTNTLGTAMTGLNTETAATKTGMDQATTATQATTPQMTKLGTETGKTQTTMQKLTSFMQGNKGMIFSVTMLSSGIVEAIGMYQGWTDASEKLAAAKEKEADLVERGMEGTKEYGEAVKDVADAQRGYNFITRFTIQSFGDLVPMALMLSTSLIEMTSKVGGLTAAKTKLISVGTKLTGVIQGVGAAMMALSTTNKVLLLLGLIATAVVALIKNWGGFRDIVNQVGVALGQMLPPLQGVLSAFGLQANAVLDTADSYLTYGAEATAATTDVEKAVMKSGDATSLTYNEQIELMAKLGDSNENMVVSMGALLQDKAKNEEASNAKYKQFVEGMTTGNEDIQKSLGLTGDEFGEFSKRFQEELDKMDENWSTGVESIRSGWDSLNSGFADSTNSTVGEIIKLEDKITELTNQQWELDDKKALKKNREEIAKNQAKIDELRGTTGSSLTDMGAMYDIFGSDVQMTTNEKITPAMEQAARDFIAFQTASTDALNSLRNGILAQDFDGTVKTMTNAVAQIPASFQSSFSEVDGILHNSSLTQREKISEIVDTYGSLEAASKPLIVGAYALSRADAEVAASLDEVAVAARSSMTDVSQSGTAWETFVANLTPAQKNLPIIQDLISKVSKGVITQEEALKRAEAAGQSWSEVMGKDVTASIKSVQKSFIDMGDGTSQMVGEVNGQMVNLGRVSNTELGKLSDDTEVVNASLSKTGQTAKTEIGNEATAAIGVFGKDGKFHFATVVDGANNIIAVFKAVDTYAGTYIEKGAGEKIAGLGTVMATTGKDVKTETDNWSTSFTGFKDAVVSSWNAITSALNTKLDLGAAAAALVESLNTAITKEFPKLVQQGGEIVTQIGNGIMDYAKTIAPSAEAVLNNFVTGTQKKYDLILKVGNAIVEQVTKGVTDFAKTIGPSGEAVVNNFITGVQKIGQAVITAGSGLVEQIGLGIEKLFPQLKTHGGGIVTAVRDGMTGAKKLIDSASNALGGWVNTAIEAFNFAKSGNTIVTNIVKGITAYATKIKEGLVSAFDAAKKAVESLFKGWDPIAGIQGGIEWLKKLITGGGIQGADASSSGGSGQIPVVPSTKVDYDITPAIGKLDQLKAYVTQTTTQISAMFLTMGQSIKLTLSQIPPAAQMSASQVSAAFITMEASLKGVVLRISTAFTPMFTQLPILAMQATSQTSAAFITMLASIQGTVSQITAQITTLQGTFSTFSTSVSTYMSSMTANTAAWGVAAIKAFSEVSKNVLVAQGVYSKFSTSVSTYMTSMKTNTASWGTTTISSLSNVSKNITATQSTASKFSTSWSSYMKSMTSAVKSFASTTVSELKKVVSAANSATSALNKMAAAAKKAAAARASVGSMQHGGTFIGHGQKGFSGIVNRPTTFRGVRMGEDFKEELVTVQPLTRGTGNHHGPTVSANNGGGNRSAPTTVVIPVMLNGREIGRAIKQMALEDYGLQT